MGQAIIDNVPTTLAILPEEDMANTQGTLVTTRPVMYTDTLSAMDHGEGV